MIDCAQVPRSAEPGSSLATTRQAIIAADISGYTRLMNLFERETHLRFLRLRAGIIQPLVVTFRGRVVKNTGDGFVAAFESSNDALQAVISLQQELALAEAAIARDRRIAFRFGLNYGEVFVEPDDIFGHAVNVAARLHDIASPGGAVLSQAVCDQLGPWMKPAIEDLGLRKLRNIKEPVRAYLLRRPRGVLKDATPDPVDDPRPARQPSLAVLPFRDLNTATGESRFVDGLHEEIASSLAALHELAVISSTSTLRYDRLTPDVETVARELGVRYVITGTRQRVGSRLRINVHLNDAESNAILSSGQYEGDLDHLFDLQDKIAVDLIGIVAPKIRKSELQRALSKRPDSMDSYDFFLHGIELLRGKSADEFARAPFFFRAAMDADNTYAPARAYAAFWHIRNIAQGWSPDVAADSRRAEELSAAAIECDPDNALGLAIHAHCKSFLAHDYDAAMPLLDRALAASPNHAIVLSFASLTASYVGQPRMALERANRSLRLAPHDLYAFWLCLVLSVAHYAGGKPAESVVWARRAVQENPRFAAGLRMLVAGLSATGRHAEAQRAAATLIEVDPKFRLSSYRRLCPWAIAAVREEFLGNLRAAGLPE